MKIHKNKIRLCICLSWLLQIYEQTGAEKSECPEFDKLLQVSKNLLNQTAWLQSSNFKANFQTFNHLLERMMREIPEDREIYPLVLTISILRHCPFDKIQGCEEIKAIDLDSLIVWARDNGCLNDWSVTKWAKHFRDFYWNV